MTIISSKEAFEIASKSTSEDLKNLMTYINNVIIETCKTGVTKCEIDVTNQFPLTIIKIVEELKKKGFTVSQLSQQQSQQQSQNTQQPKTILKVDWSLHLL